MPETPSQNKRDVVLNFSPSSMGTGGKSWFFGIGINKYTHFTPLYNAVKDVQDLIKLLQEQYDLTAEYSLTLYNDEATRKNIIKMLDRLQREVGPSDKLIIYYSGHGHLNKDTNKGYWIPTDAERDNTSEYIRNSTIREYIETLKPLHTLLISDSCFSGTLFVRGASRSTAAVHELATIPSRWAICSGRHDEEVFDGEPGANSPFAESIMDTLRWNQKKEINVARLVDRVIDQTRSNYKQLPEGNPLYGVGHKGGQYIFNRRVDEGVDSAKAKVAGTIVAKEKIEDNKRGAEQTKNQRKAAWTIANNTATEEAYWKFLSAYPMGRFTGKAKTALKNLQQAKTDEAATREAKHTTTTSQQEEPTEDSWLQMAMGILVAVAIVVGIGWGISKLWNMISGSEDPVPKIENSSPEVEKSETFTSKTINIDGLNWMAENLNIATPDSWCYDDNLSNCNRYGRLYTWEAAKKGCASLGAGWRLPTKEEWEALGRKFGGFKNGLGSDTEKGNAVGAYHALVSGGYSGFSVLLGGMRGPSGSSEKWVGLGSNGYYWGGHIFSPSTASFSNYLGLIINNTAEKSQGFSCRCVQNTN